MKYIFSIFLLLISIISQAQSTGNSNSTAGSASFFSKQKAIASNPFFQQVSKDPQQAEAWLQLYNSVSRAGIASGEKKQLLKETFYAAQTYINGSWQFSLLKFLQSGRRDSSAIHQALQSAEAKKQLYPYAIQWALIANNRALLFQYCKELYQLESLTPLQHEYHYNVMMSTAPNAILYAKGLTDLVPMLMLQQVLQLRQDIQFRFFEETTMPVNGYLCLSLGKETISRFREAAYSGLLVNLQPGKNELATNLEQNFNWKQFDAIQALNETDKILYRNYFPSLIILYKEYSVTKNARAVVWKLRIEKLARLTGTTALVNKQMGW